MRKRWIPFIIACMVAVLVIGLRAGSISEAERHQFVEMTVSPTIAVVNADAGTYINGTSLNYAAAIIDTLGSRFTLVSPAMAQSGLNSGMYSAIVTFPSNVSTRILSFNAYQPERVEVDFIISPLLSDREFLETYLELMGLQMAINTTLANTYVSSIFRQFHDAQDQVSGVFQNSLADLMALELLTLGNFTDGMELDYMPFVPLNPRQLDTDFYFGQVYAFAADISGWYLRSYEMASDQFLWMREGLFALTADFPEQENTWLEMLSAWTWYSEEYGRLLEIYSAYISTHDQSLFEWFNENTHWNESLEDFQTQLAAWHSYSQEWFETGERWHTDYLGYLNSVVEFQEALEAFQAELSTNSVSVQDELNDWLRLLETFREDLYNQIGDLEKMVLTYNFQADEANVFLTDLVDWHLSLAYHYYVFVDWLDEVNQRQDDMNDFLEELTDNQHDMQSAIDTFVEGVIDFVPMPDALENIVDLSGYWGAITEPVSPYLPTLTPPSLPSGHLPDILALDTVNIPPLPPNVTPLPNLPALNFNNTLPFYLVFEVPDHARDAIQDWVNHQIQNAYISLDNWRNEVEPIVEATLDWYDEIQSPVQTLGDRGQELEDRRVELASRLTQIEDILIELVDFYTELNYLYNHFDDSIQDFQIWGNILNDISYILYDWEYYLTSHADEMLTWHTIIRDFSDDLYQLTMPELPDYAHWNHLESPYDAHVGIFYALDPLEPLTLPQWNEGIHTPPEYGGTQIAYALDRYFPLQDHVMTEPFAMILPPEYTGMLQPNAVGYHYMTMAERPESPLLPPPPRPDDFWSSLDNMHDQLSQFDVTDFLSDDVTRMVDNSLRSYSGFLDNLSESQVHLFSDNVSRMYEVHDIYTQFLNSLRNDVFHSHAVEHATLQGAIETFAGRREDSIDDTQRRLGEFSTMMPETRVMGGINQSVVDFTVAPFEFATFSLDEHNSPVLAQVVPMAETYDRYLAIVLIIVAMVLTVTVASPLITQLIKKQPKTKR
ncbi:MAG: hypothetical protein FWE05_09380 [Defluviitaleaceae bacterium]|nr:hypothetical protein [Defluviitaleaceae bacterium]